MAQEVEELPLRDAINDHLSDRAKEIYSSAYNMIWIHTEGEKEEREYLAHQVAWDRLKQEYNKKQARIRFELNLSQGFSRLHPGKK
ncbi:ChaB family protein [Salinithrix halophila]|uniref:ChaB family protein n=1 Tax=Salinithrix halophila TaxID=1485204 RepID=UPI0036D28FAC